MPNAEAQGETLAEGLGHSPHAEDRWVVARAPAGSPTGGGSTAHVNTPNRLSL
jgi:hypothetical protein